MYDIGDVILYRDGPNIISKLIRLIEGNEITHCAVVISPNITNPLLLEIENSTSLVRTVRLFDTLNYTDEIYMSKISNKNRIYDINYIKKISAIYIGSKYAKLELFNAMINHFIGLFNKNYIYKTYFDVNMKYTCSSLVANFLNSIELTNFKNPNIIEPDDFTIAPWIMERIK